MIPAWIAAVAAVATFVASMVAAASISRRRWGDLRRDVDIMMHDVAEIKGMFELRLKG